MDAATLLTLIVIAAAIYVLFRIIRSGMDSIKGAPVPGPKPFPFFGNILDVNTGKLHISFANIAKWYGAIFQVNLLGRTVVVINDCKLLRKVFASDQYGDVFDDRPDAAFANLLLYNSSDLYFGKIGQKTMTLRKLFQNALTLYGEKNEHFEHNMEKILKEFVKDLRETAKQDFDIDYSVRKSFANATACLLSGRPADECDSEVIWQFIDNGNKLGEPGAVFIFDCMPFIRFLPGKFRNIFLATLKTRDAVLDRYYFRTKDRLSNSSYENEPVGFVAELLKFQREENLEQNKEFINDSNIKGLIIDSVFGATESTASAVINSLALLVEYRDVARAVQNEIDKIIGNERLPKIYDKNNMPYTMATILEVLRYTSHVPLGVPHRALKSYNLEGYFVPKHAVVYPNLWYIHHDPRIWNDPWTFKPERFLDSDGQLLPPQHKYMQNLLPFSTGQRKCPGEDFGKSHMFLYITTILQSHELLPSSAGQMPDTDPRNYERGSVLNIKKFFCRAIPRV